MELEQSFIALIEQSIKTNWYLNALTDYKGITLQYRDVARAKLALWYNEIEEFGYDTFTTVANSIENHYERILNYFVNRSTNAAAEAFNAKIKAFRASFRGVVDKRFFLYRLAKVYA